MLVDSFAIIRPALFRYLPTTVLVCGLIGTTKMLGAQSQDPPGNRQFEAVLQLMPQLTRPVAAGYLGISIADINADRAKILKLNEERGVEIKAVRQGSPADAAGLQPGDVLLTYNGEDVVSTEQMFRLVRETPPGRKIKLQLSRDGKIQRTVVVVTEAPDMPQFIPGGPMQNWPDIDMVPRPLMVWSCAVLGIDFERVDSQLADYFGVKGGVLVRSVGHGSIAERAGVKAGDVIFSVAQQPLLTEHDFSSALRHHSGTVPLSVMRDHKRVDLTIMIPQ
jgi:serine protease Do